MRRILYFIMMAVVLLLTACTTRSSSPDAPTRVGKLVEVDEGAYTDISAEELEAMLTDKNFVFVNVHIPFEGNIHDTDLSIPYDQINQSLDQLPADKNAKIVLYCRSGRMSDLAARDLVKAGYTDVYNLAGGFNAWEAAGLPLEGK